MFNEYVHAFLITSFYKHLVGTFPDNGKDVFVFATEKYGEQRGSRMAQRVIRDKENLDFRSYFRYGEWFYTCEENHCTCIVSLFPNFTVNVHKCPWYDKFKELDCLDGAKLYCANIDKSLVRGFNPRLTFEATHTYEKDGYCELVQKDAEFLLTDDFTSKEGNIKPWEYHCAHLYHTFEKVIKSIYSDNADTVISNVRQDFKKAYGDKMLEIVDSYNTTDFDYI